MPRPYNAYRSPSRQEQPVEAVVTPDPAPAAEVTVESSIFESGNTHSEDDTGDMEAVTE